MRRLALLGAAGAMLAPGVAHARAASCATTFRVGSDHGLEIIGYAISARHMSCAYATREARQFASKKIYGQPVEECAIQADQSGCYVNGFVCRTRGAVTLRSTCTNGRQTLWFVEVDRDNG